MTDSGRDGVVIVVVEDDPEMRQAIIRLLRVARFQAVAYSSGEVLLEAGIAAKAGCLVLDIHLPGMTGFELRERLTESGVTAPVVFVTAHDSPAARAQAAKAGAVAFLRKPFEARRLIDAVHQAFMRAGALPPVQPRSDP